MEPSMKEDNDRILELLDRANHSIVGEQWRNERSDESREHTVTKLKEEVVSLHMALSEVESKLRVKEDLCSRLETALHRLVKGRGAPRLSLGTSNPEIKMTAWETINEQESLTAEYFKDQFQYWRSQVWFSKQAPPAVDAIFEKLATSLENAYESRRTALTMVECFNMVDKVRAEWEVELPLLIRKALSMCTTVHKSNAEAREGVNGTQCEAVHFLIYMVHKMYNKAGQTLSVLKKREGLSALNGQYNITPLKGEPLRIGSTSGPPSIALSLPEAPIAKSKWYENPAMDIALRTARNAVKNSTIASKGLIEETLKLTVARLVGSNKPKLEESLQYIASVIALKEHADVYDWKLDASLFAHREIFQYKMIEHWNTVGYKRNWDNYCCEVFRCINSFVTYLYICDANKATIQHLEEILRPANRREYSVRGPEDLHKFLDKCCSGSLDYASFYVKAYVNLLQFVAAVDEGDTLPESVLLNLLLDIGICSDLLKLSGFEKNDYVKVMSIITTTMDVTSSHLIRAEGVRRKYAAAALFIGARFKYLMKLDELTTVEETTFWGGSTPDISSLAGRSDKLHTYRSVLPRVRLPPVNDHAAGTVNGYNYNDDDPPTSIHFTTVTARIDNEGVGGPLTSSDSILGRKETVPTVPNDVTGESNFVDPKGSKLIQPSMKVQQLRQILNLRGMSSEGKKRQLQERLIREAGYVLVPKRHKRTWSSLSQTESLAAQKKSRREKSDSENSDAEDSDS